MYMLVLQTFLLMMAAFLLGATFACLLKRTLHRATDELPEDALHIDVPPAVRRSEAVAVPASTPPAPVSRAEARRFERALTGDVPDAPVGTASVRQAGPVIEVQPLPVPPPPAPPPAPRVVDVAPEPPHAGYVAEAAKAGAGALAAHETYAAVAVASHDGSMLPPPAVVEADLPPPTMPTPAPEPLPVPRVEIPAVPRPEDAPPDPDPSYAAEALAAGAVYVPPAEDEVVDFDLPTPSGSDEFSVPPPGETYASVALGGGVSEPEPVQTEPVVETKSTHVSTALAAAAGLAAARAAAGAPAGSDADDLTRIRGIDEVLASRLHYIGVTRFAQIARWDANDVRRMSQSLGFFGRIQDEYWIDQARLLAGVDDRPPPASAPSYATSAGAADIATAAAAAAAAAMAATASRGRSAEAPARPAKLADAIRENTDHDATETGGRSSLTGLRSVRAEALLGEDAEFVRGDLDDLKRIRGIGVLIEKKLNSLGVTSYEQVANWSAADVERISDILDFKGRIERENWIEQARILASGGQTEFSRRVDRGEV